MNKISRPHGPPWGCIQELNLIWVRIGTSNLYLMLRFPTSSNSFSTSLTASFLNRKLFHESTSRQTSPPKCHRYQTQNEYHKYLQNGENHLLRSQPDHHQYCLQKTQDRNHRSPWIKKTHPSLNITSLVSRKDKDRETFHIC